MGEQGRQAVGKGADLGRAPPGSSWEDWATSGEQAKKRSAWRGLVISGRVKRNSNLEGFASGTLCSTHSGRAPLSGTEKSKKQIESS